MVPINVPNVYQSIQETLNSYINLFADDAKLLRALKNYDDCMELQRDSIISGNGARGGNQNSMQKNVM